MAVDTKEAGRVAEAVSKSVLPESFKPRDIPEVYPADINWNIVYHRIQVGEATHRQCEYEDCISYLAMIHGKYWPEVVNG